MKNLKNVFILFIFWVIFIIFGTINSNASSDLYLNNLDFKSQINSDGSMNVVETWDIKIEDTNTLYKTFKIDNSKYSNITNVVVKEITNNQENNFLKTNTWAYHLNKDYYFAGENPDGLFEISWGVGLENRSVTKKYEISYTVEDVITKYNDYSELYWQFVGKDFEIDAKKITGEILLPYKAETSDEIKVWGHTEDLNGEIYQTALNKIEFNLNNFRHGKYIEVRTLFPTYMITYCKKQENIDILDSVVKEETVWANEANRRKEISKRNKFIVCALIIIVSIIIDIFFIYRCMKIWKKIKNTKKLEPSEKIIYYREIPREKEVTPAEGDALFFTGGRYASVLSVGFGKVFSATLLDLSLKKFIDFEVTKIDTKKEIVTIKLLKEDAQELESYKDEKRIFEFLKSAMEEKREITIKELEKYIQKHPSKVEKLGTNIGKDIEERLYKNEFLTKETTKQKTKIETEFSLYIIFTIFAAFMSFVSFMTLENVFVTDAILLAVLFGIGISIVSGILNKKTSYGTQKLIDEIPKWKGLKKYMEDFSMIDKRELPEIVLWEKFLVYATVFGIEKKVLEQLKIVYPDFESNTDINTASYMYLMMNTDFNNSFSKSISTSISSAYSSGSGSGGGFSGGGGGGRRPVEEAEEDNCTAIIV